jgi:hypothetical protein
MFDGSTSGRAFESQFGLYAFGVIAIISTILWLWFHFEIRKNGKEDRIEGIQDD